MRRPGLARVTVPLHSNIKPVIAKPPVPQKKDTKKAAKNADCSDDEGAGKRLDSDGFELASD